jgi:outer membrane biosynthesis protein TonB
MNSNKLKKNILYLLIGILIFIIIKNMPNNKLSNMDILLISSITVILSICLNNAMVTDLCPVDHKKEKFDIMDRLKEINKIQQPSQGSPSQASPSQGSVKSSEKNTQVEVQPSVKPIFQTSPQPSQPSQPSQPPQPPQPPSKPSQSQPPSKPSQSQPPSKPQPKPSLSPQPQSKPSQSKPSQSKPSQSKPSQSKRQPQQLEIRYPFDKIFMLKTIDDMMLAKDDTKIADRIRQDASKNQYYEIFIQLIQTNVDALYKNIQNDYNKINELIMDIKIKRGVELNKMNSYNDKLKKSAEEVHVTGPESSNKYLKTLLNEGKYIDNYGFIQNMIDNDMKYSIYTPKQHEQLGTYDQSFTNKWDHDYVLLNTDKWRPPIGHHLYKCKTEQKCQVCPTLTKGYPLNLKEFNNARKIMPPDIINLDYINEKLLTGAS